MRKLLITAIGLALALSLAVSATASAEEPAPGSEEALPGAPSEVTPASVCPILNVCVYTKKEFEGAEGRTTCSATGFHPLAGTKLSIRNSCEQRAVFLRWKGHYTGVCMEPLTQFSFVEIDEFRLGEQHSHC